MFDSDAWWLDKNPSSEFHVIDREVCLVDEDENRIYLSWIQNSDEFEIAYSPRSHFVNHGFNVRDMSTHGIWVDLVGQKISFEYLDESKLILKIVSGNHKSFCCAYDPENSTIFEDNWGNDVLYISKNLPPIPSNFGAINV
jgi:hypothetical protein